MLLPGSAHMLQLKHRVSSSPSALPDSGTSPRAAKGLGGVGLRNWGLLRFQYLSIWGYIRTIYGLDSYTR